ncbi:MAG: metal-dependent hydrolase [Acidiferrobacterales bacterium]|nr:metal-dependent hydrolase [Acidiferrobacterales bacterium]
MDSISQAMLGSAVALIATRGRKPKQAILVGATLGTLPDLDVLVPFDNDLDSMTRHRSWSHSWLVHMVVAPMIAWGLGYVDRSWKWMNRLLTVLCILISHSALDALTIYGTWLFWPFGVQPVMGGSIFIIDPLYTLPLLLSVIWIWRFPESTKRIPLIAVATIATTAYLGWGLSSKRHIEELAQQSLQRQGIFAENLVATPTPFNSILWRIVAIDQNRFHEGFYSYAAPNSKIAFQSYDRGLDLIKDVTDHASLEQFASFNHGFHAYTRAGDRILGQDLRMGTEPFYFFQFEFARAPSEENDLDKPVMLEPNSATMKIEILDLFSWIGKRLFTEDLLPLTSDRRINP